MDRYSVTFAIQFQSLGDCNAVPFERWPFLHRQWTGDWIHRQDFLVPPTRGLPWEWPKDTWDRAFMPACFRLGKPSFRLGFLAHGSHDVVAGSCQSGTFLAAQPTRNSSTHLWNLPKALMPEAYDHVVASSVAVTHPSIAHHSHGRKNRRTRRMLPLWLLAPSTQRTATIENYQLKLTHVLPTPHAWILLWMALVSVGDGTVPG